jgi:hypothetical protein
LLSTEPARLPLDNRAKRRAKIFDRLGKPNEIRIVAQDIQERGMSEKIALI